MIIEVNGQQVEVDDSFATLPPEQQQVELAHITQVMSPPKASVEVRGANPEDLVNPLIGTGVGAVAGEVFGPVINKGMEAARKGAPVAGAAGAPGSANGAAPGQKYAAKTGYGSGPGYTTEEVIEHKKAQERPIGKGKISGKIAGNSPMNLDQMMALDVEKKAEAARRAAALNQGMSLGDKIMSKMPGPVQSVGRFLGGATQSGVAPWLGRAVAGGGVGFQGADAYNRYQQGDYPGAAISTIGAMGAGSSFFPTPVTRLGGPAISVGAEVLNAYLDKLKQKAEQPPAPPPAPAQAPLSPQGAAPAQPAPQAMAKGGLATLAGGGKAEAAKKLFAPVASKILKASEALGAHEGKKLGLTQTDNFGVHGGRMGGNRFPDFQNTSPIHQRDQVVWMNDSEKHARDMVNRGGEDTIWSTYIGAPDQLKSNKSVFNDILQQHYKRDLTPEQIELINKRISTLAKDPKKGTLMFPQSFDIRDKFAASELGGDTFDRRAALAEILGEGKGVKGTKAGIAMPEYQDILRSHRDPLTEGVPTSSVGTRLFTVDRDTPTRFSQEYHPDYNWTVHGKDTGVQFEQPIPQRLAVPDWYNEINARAPGKTHGNAWFSYMKEPQVITEDMLTKMQKEGFAKGGLVHLLNLLKKK